MSDSLDPLKAARAAREEAERKYAEATKAAYDADEIAQEERAAKEYDILLKLSQEHGVEGKGIFRVATELGMVVVKRPAFVHYKEFMNTEKHTDAECGKLVRRCVVYPDKDRLNAILEEQPAVLITLTKACAYLAGARKEEIEGKFARP